LKQRTSKNNAPLVCEDTQPKLTKKGVLRRWKNFLTLEDETLCSTYLNVSKDPIVGTNQPMKSY
jgi:hypothetical protein